mmetsp:Transcript_24290/g.68215  ORF Transcript_24290/g.68215 Transcript_24290/m.68215 type:complete len:225 (-) Transcript_24290:91-765(-)
MRRTSRCAREVTELRTWRPATPARTPRCSAPTSCGGSAGRPRRGRGGGRCGGPSSGSWPTSGRVARQVAGRGPRWSWASSQSETASPEEGLRPATTIAQRGRAGRRTAATRRRWRQHRQARRRRGGTRCASLGRTREGGASSCTIGEVVASRYAGRLLARPWIGQVSFGAHRQFDSPRSTRTTTPSSMRSRRSSRCRSSSCCPRSGNRTTSGREDRASEGSGLG